MEELRQLTARLVEQSAQEQAESLAAEEAAARHTLAEEQRTAAMLAIQSESTALAKGAESAEAVYLQAVQQAQELGTTLREAQARLVGIRRAQQETTQHLEHAREELSAARARRTSIEEILRERAYTADAVQKLFSASGSCKWIRRFRCVRRRIPGRRLARRLCRGAGTV